MNARKLKYFIIKHFAQIWAPLIFRLYCQSLRIERRNGEIMSDLMAQGRKVLLCCLHQHLFVEIAVLPLYTRINPGIPIIISPSKDGDIVADLIERMGAAPVRGSSSQNGSRALKAMIASMKDAPLGVHVVDGPRGPRSVVKPGLIEIARATGAVIVPCYVKPSRAWYCKSWDRFFVPKPFSRAVFWLGAPIELPETAAMDKNALEELRQKVEDQMNREQGLRNG